MDSDQSLIDSGLPLVTASVIGELSVIEGLSKSGPTKDDERRGRTVVQRRVDKR